ncbi:MAG: hypothetical protein FJ102_14660 [Deltaproteobacteria bacterium]|nr:hypothetical protein [Deltaproteobacteria bacterium]
MVLILAACIYSSDDSDTAVTWSGWVYGSPDASEDTVLAEGHVSFWVEPFDAEPVAASQPYEDYPGYWQVELLPAVAVNVRVSSDLSRPAVWAGDVPADDGSWFSGALFAADDAWLEDLFDALDGDGDLWVDGAREGGVLVLGTPATADIDCATLTVNDEAASCWVVADDGSVTRATEGLPTYFAAIAAPGDVFVRAGEAEEHYVADAGDVVFALYFFGDSS